jgi:hypothetical protein
LGLDDETVYRIDKCMLEKLAQEKLDSLVAPAIGILGIPRTKQKEALQLLYA